MSVVINMSCFFKYFFTKDPPVSVEESILKVNGNSSSKQQTLELNVLSSRKISPEIIWALHCCLNGISNNSNQDASSLFQTMFPDSKIAKSFKMRPNKIGCRMTNSLGLYFKGLLIEKLNESPWLVMSFDRSLNKKTQTCQMDLLIRHWNKEKMQLEVRLRDSLFMGHCTSHDLKNHLNERASDFNLNKILKILKILNKVSVDDPSVNLKFYQNVPKAIVKSLKYPDLLTLEAVPCKNSWCIQNGS